MSARTDRKAQYDRIHAEAEAAGVLVPAMRELCRSDLFYLLTRGLGRADIDHDWLFERCVDVQLDPDNRLDLWAREHYKDLADDTPVLTVDGWKPHGSLVVGDLVYSPSGDRVAVIAVSDRFTDSACYMITFSDGERITAGAGHIWKLRVKHKNRVKGGGRAVTFSEKLATTEEIAKMTGRVDVGVAAPLNNPTSNLPIDPYTFGIWLGDGHSDGGRITVHREDCEIIEAIRGAGVEVVEQPARQGSGAGLYSIGRGVRGRVGTGISSILRELGVKNNKHIPHVVPKIFLSLRAP